MAKPARSFLLVTQVAMVLGLASPVLLAQTGVTVKSRVNQGGELNPAVAVLEPNESLHLVVQPEPGYKLKQIHGCDGQYHDGLFLIERPQRDCVVNATFMLDPGAKLPATAAENATAPSVVSAEQASAAASAAAATGRKSNMMRFIVVAHQVMNVLTVTAAVTAGIGTVTPLSQKVNKGSTAKLTVTPANGYVVSNVSGCGLQTQQGGVLTTPAITASCTVSVAFVALLQGVWDNFNWDQANWS